MSIWFALVLISLCAVLWDAGIILQKLAVDTLPRIRLDRGLGGSLRRLLSSGRWMAGLAASAAGWGLFAWALAFTPVSVARAIQGFGFVILAVFSMVFLRQKLTAADWSGISLVTAGVAALGIAERTPGPPGPVSMAGLLPGIAVCLAAAVGVWGVSILRKSRAPGVVTFSVTAGLLLGVGDVLTKVALVEAQRGAWPAFAAAAACLVAFYISGFLVLSRAYQHGRPIVVTAVSDLCARLVAIFLGVAALGEVPAADPVPRVLTVAGFAAILTGAFLLSRFGGGELASALSAGSRGGKSEIPGKAQEGKSSVPTEVDPDR
jgi:drug/metabolite transporter (DMT)-like permease